MPPDDALLAVKGTAAHELFYHHMPLLVLFGGLSMGGVVSHNAEALAAAEITARLALPRCVVGVVERPKETEVRVRRSAGALRVDDIVLWGVCVGLRKGEGIRGREGQPGGVNTV
jgi:hypothetical protein